MDSIDLFQTWRNANQAAVVAAKAVLVKSILALDGQGEPPTAAETEEVRALRGRRPVRVDGGPIRRGRRRPAVAAGTGAGTSRVHFREHLGRSDGDLMRPAGD